MEPESWDTAIFSPLLAGVPQRVPQYAIHLSLICHAFFLNIWTFFRHCVNPCACIPQSLQLPLGQTVSIEAVSLMKVTY